MNRACFLHCCSPGWAPLRAVRGVDEGEGGAEAPVGSWVCPGACGPEGKSRFRGGVGGFSVGHIDLEVQGPTSHSLQVLVIGIGRGPVCLQGPGRSPLSRLAPQSLSSVSCFSKPAAFLPHIPSCFKLACLCLCLPAIIPPPLLSRLGHPHLLRRSVLLLMHSSIPLALSAAWKMPDTAAGLCGLPTPRRPQAT